MALDLTSRCFLRQKSSSARVYLRIIIFSIFGLGWENLLWPRALSAKSATINLKRKRGQCTERASAEYQSSARICCNIFSFLPSLFFFRSLFFSAMLVRLIDRATLTAPREYCLLRKSSPLFKIKSRLIPSICWKNGAYFKLGARVYDAWIFFSMDRYWTLAIEVHLLERGFKWR